MFSMFIAFRAALMLGCKLDNSLNLLDDDFVVDDDNGSTVSGIEAVEEISVSRSLSLSTKSGTTVEKLLILLVLRYA